MINRYLRAGRSVQELELGELTPLDVALDWNDDYPGIAPDFVGQDRLELSANGLRERGTDPQRSETKEDPGDAGDARRVSSATVEAVGQSGGNETASAEVADPVEAALADALTKASAAGQWTVVEMLSRELTARREARAGVVTLDVERAKRGRS